MHIKLFLSSNSVIAILFFIQLYFGGNLIAQECKAKVEIISNRDNSLIYIDSVFIGRGKVSTELTKNNYSLVIKESMWKWGQAQIIDTLKIRDCEEKYLFTYEFKNPEVSFNQAQPFGIGYTKSEESFFKSGTFKILLGSAAVLGGIAAYFKIQADKKYDDYLQSKNQSMLDEVDRLDMVSGISFGLLQINFGYLIYKFLTD
ncbi:hypothetical protein C0389_00860 [bacterium]|nr:hypothetical protein [bacterium]